MRRARGSERGWKKPINIESERLISYWVFMQRWRSMKKNELRGYLYILVGATLWVSRVWWPNRFSSSGFLPLNWFKSDWPLLRLPFYSSFSFTTENVSSFPWRIFLIFLILGLVGVAGVQFTYYYTISKIHVGPAVLIQYLSPIWIALYAFLFKKNPSRRQRC